MNWQGRTAFITGGVSGIGLGIAQAFAGAGMKVILAYRNEAHRKSNGCAGRRTAPQRREE